MSHDGHMGRLSLSWACLAVLLVGCQAPISTDPQSRPDSGSPRAVTEPTVKPPALPDVRPPPITASATPDTSPDGLIFDSTEGLLHTDSKATALASITCNVGGYANLTFHFGATMPHYYSWRIFDVRTSTWVSDWAVVQQVQSANASPGDIITTPGHWLVAAGILHYDNGQWYVDEEFTVVHNRYAVHQRYCEL